MERGRGHRYIKKKEKKNEWGAQVKIVFSSRKESRILEKRRTEETMENQERSIQRRERAREKYDTQDLGYNTRREKTDRKCKW